VPTGYYEDQRYCSIKINTQRSTWRWATYPSRVYSSRDCAFSAGEKYNSERKLSLVPITHKSEIIGASSNFTQLYQSNRYLYTIANATGERWCYILSGSKSVITSIEFRLPFTYSNDVVFSVCKDPSSFRYCSFATRIYLKEFFLYQDI